MSLIIVDYDETFTSMPDMWIELIGIMERYGNTVICCTNRVGDKYADADVIAAMKVINIPVVFAATFKDKWEAVTQAGYYPENAIWIDDRPMYIWLNREPDTIPD